MLRCIYLTVALLAALHASAAFSGGLCGNGTWDAGEQCDDGNTSDGDGCNASCAVEPGWQCSAASLPVAGANHVADGGFESGTPNPAWQEASSNFGSPICSVESCGGPVPADGSFHAWFGGIGGTTENASVTQTLLIPATARALVFDLAITACDSDADQVMASIDGIVVYSSGACIVSFDSQPVVVDISAYADDGLHTLQLSANTLSAQGGLSNFFVDNVVVSDAPDTAVSPSICEPANEVCFADDFNLGAAVWTTYSNGAVPWNWTLTDSGDCGSRNGIEGNFTGGDGEAACVDSDVAGNGAVDAYLCSPELGFAGSTGLALDFKLNYQVFGQPDEQDRFAVLLSTTGPAGPFETTLFESQDNLGGLYALPGADVQIDLGVHESAPAAWICFRYSADFDWYGQLDDVRVTATSCGFQVTDADGDGLVNSLDNCTEVANPAQTDTDGDGFGNACDPDIAPGSGDGVVNFLDLGAMKAAFFTIPGNPAYNPAADLNGDNNVNFLDVGILRQFLFQPPGPSGLVP